MEPISTIGGAWTIVKTAGEATKKLYLLSKQIKDQTIRQQVDEVLDELRDLKHQASLLEEENRELKAKLRFNSDEFEFHDPFWYKKGYKKTPLCPKCFSNHVAAPIGQGANLECPKMSRLWQLLYAGYIYCSKALEQLSLEILLLHDETADEASQSCARSDASRRAGVPAPRPCRSLDFRVDLCSNEAR